MKAEDQPITKIIAGECQYVIPVFQRDFRWTDENFQQLWLDLLSNSNEDATQNHFIGSIVYIAADQPTSTFQRWSLIDGQQRMTTLILLLISLRDHIRETGWSGNEGDPTAEKIDDLYLKNRHEVDEKRYKLVLRRKDNATLKKLIDGNGLDELSERSELLVDAYEYFREKLREPTSDPGAIFKGIARLKAVDVTLELGVDNPQLVFESMNSTGVSLHQSDLVRNHLLMDHNEEQQTRLYNEYWHKIESCFSASEEAFDSFLRDYMALRKDSTEQTRLDRIYHEFKYFWSSSNEGSLEDLLEDMVNMARNYASFLGIKKMQRPWLAEAMGNMRLVGTTQGVLIMRLYDSHEKNLLSNDEFVMAVKLIESYILRRAVLSLSANSYWAIFARIAHELNREPVEPVFMLIKVAFAKLVGNNRFPNDEEFRRSITQNDLYGLRVCKHILDRLENDGQREPSPVSDYSIEHIMPQNIDTETGWQEMLGQDWADSHATYLHRLGNLTLTAYNSTYSNRSFDEKKTITGGFQQSAVRLNQDIRDKETWTDAEIESRGGRLADQALLIWPHHEADTKLVQEEHIRELENRSRQKNIHDLNMNNSVRDLLTNLLESIRRFADFFEVIENRSVCCYGPEFFAELLPMSGHVRVILPLEPSEVSNLGELKVYDVSTWHYVKYRIHKDSNLLVEIRDEEEIATASLIVRKAFQQVS